MFWRCESVKFTAVEVIRVMMNCRHPQGRPRPSRLLACVLSKIQMNVCKKMHFIGFFFFLFYHFTLYHTVLITIRHFLHANIDLFVKANEIKIAIQLLFCVNYSLKEV